jgi:hypothetical protein
MKDLDLKRAAREYIWFAIALVSLLIVAAARGTT